MPSPRRSIPSDCLRPGYVLPGALCDASGRALYAAGTELTEQLIAKLGNRIITGLYAGDDWPAEVAESKPKPKAQHPSTPEPKPKAQPKPTPRPKPPSTPSGPKVGVGQSRTPGAPPDKASRSEPTGDTQSVSVDMLRLGMCLSQDIFDPQGVLLLAAGKQITSRFLQLLSQRNIQVVSMRGAEQPVAASPPPVQQTAMGAPDLERAGQLEEHFTAELERHPAFRSRDPAKRPHLSLSALRGEAERGLEMHIQTSDVLTGMCESIQSGRTISGDKMQCLVSEFATMLTLDCDLLSTIVGLKKAQGEYLFDHCVNVALMSMTVAAQLNMRRDQIFEIGLGAVFQDVGMLRIPDSVRLAPRQLTAAEWMEIQRHPFYTLDYLERIRGLSTAAKFVGFQMHERADGQGYPRRRRATTIHPFAKIAAIADIYTAMTRPRPYREPILPHDTVKRLLAEGHLDKLDRTVIRAFLDSVSVFPIGSLVELGQGTIGQVIRANPGAHTRPIIAVIGSDGSTTDGVIDLAQEQHIEVVRALELANSGTTA